MTTEPTPTPEHGSLVLSALKPAGRNLGLRPGDTLIAINGRPFDGQVSTLLKRYGNGSRQVELALTFRRDGKDWTVLSKTPRLGQFRKDTGVEYTADPRRSDPGALVNWEVYSLDNEVYDAQKSTTTMLALIAPLYLIQMRLWTPLAIWGALTALCFPLGWIGGIPLQILMALYFWQAAPVLFRRDRLSRGFRSWRMVAARSERDLHKTMQDIAPQLRFVLSPRSKSNNLESSSGPLTSGG